ncbi:hypothetical protein HK101_010941, partial [Irineochytrium annulatum]
MDRGQLDPVNRLLSAGPGPDVAALTAFTTSAFARASTFPIAAGPEALALGTAETRPGNLTASASAFRGGDHQISGAYNMQYSTLPQTAVMPLGSMPSHYATPSQDVSIGLSAPAGSTITTIAPAHSSDEQAALQASKTLAVLSRDNNGNHFHQQRDPIPFTTRPGGASALRPLAPHPSTQHLANKAAGNTSTSPERVKVPTAAVVKREQLASPST